ncbi:protein of unknown function [Streptomyces sp. KY75]|nr:protein of unknown function [Streptomyces sp. KY75]
MRCPGHMGKGGVKALRRSQGLR